MKNIKSTGILSLLCVLISTSLIACTTPGGIAATDTDGNNAPAGNAVTEGDGDGDSDIDTNPGTGGSGAGTGTDPDPDPDPGSGSEPVPLLPVRIEAECSFGATAGDCNGVSDGTNISLPGNQWSETIPLLKLGTPTVVGAMDTGVWLAFPGIEFTGFTHIAASVASDSASGAFEFRLDAPDGALLGTMTLPNTSSWTVFQEVNMAITPTSGVHTLYVLVTSPNNATGICDVDWFELSASDPVDPVDPDGDPDDDEDIPGTDYYVSLAGSDSNDGSEAAPWRNISTALSAVGAGSVVNVGAGTFVETNYLHVPAGVSLVGAGSSDTHIQVNKYYNLENHMNSCEGQGGPGWDPAVEEFAIQIANGSNQTFKGFSMDGQARANHGAIYMETGDQVVFTDLDIRNFKFTAIWLYMSTSCEIRNSYFENNTFGTGGQDAGNIMFHANTDLSIHDNDILETGIMAGKGGYGIKSYSKLHVNACFWQTWDHNWTSWSVGMKIYNNSIIVPSLGTWLAGGSDVPDITIELNSLSVEDCEIYDNYLTNHISLIGHATGINSFNVHHNYFDLGQEYRYTMEADAHGIEFHHNYINGGFYPIAQWGNNATVDDLRVHHNVFFAPQNSLINVDHSGFSNFKFVNNTVYLTNALTSIFNTSGGTGSFSNAELKNNLFVGTGTSFTNASLGGNVSNNGFQGVNTFGTASISGDMKLVGSGDHPAPYFTLQSNSPAVDAGIVIAGYTDGSTGVPDLGAFENGVTPWVSGSR